MLCSPPSNRKSKIIFGVDDDKLNLNVLEAFVTHAGYTFMPFLSAKECLLVIERVKPRLILLDIQMPEMDGFETCRKFRSLPGFDRIPIIFVTALNTPIHVQQGMAAGGNDFILKPIDKDRLLRRIEYWTTQPMRLAANG